MAKWPNLTDLVCWRWRWAEVTSSPPQVFELIKVIRVIMALIVKVVIVVALIDIFMIIVYVTLWY